MKTGFLFAFFPVLILVSHTVVAQSRKAQETIPSYDQIRQKDRENYDYVNKDGTAHVVEKGTLNLFDYPSGTVTYVLNGKPSNNSQYVRRVLAKKGRSIEFLAISKPDSLGKRVIEIRYKN